MILNCRKLLLALLLSLLFGATGASAGESGTLFCTQPGCGYQDNFTIGGGMKSPSVTGYCTHGHGFVRVKLKDWKDYRKVHYCPQCHRPIKPIYAGSEVSQFPCPRCGNLTLKYQRRLMFD